MGSAVLSRRSKVAARSGGDAYRLILAAHAPTYGWVATPAVFPARTHLVEAPRMPGAVTLLQHPQWCVFLILSGLGSSSAGGCLPLATHCQHRLTWHQQIKLQPAKLFVHSAAAVFGVLWVTTCPAECSSCTASRKASNFSTRFSPEEELASTSERSHDLLGSGGQLLLSSTRYSSNAATPMTSTTQFSCAQS